MKTVSKKWWFCAIVCMAQSISLRSMNLSHNIKSVDSIKHVFQPSRLGFVLRTGANVVHLDFPTGYVHGTIGYRFKNNCVLGLGSGYSYCFDRFFDVAPSIIPVYLSVLRDWKTKSGRTPFLLAESGVQFNCEPVFYHFPVRYRVQPFFYRIGVGYQFGKKHKKTALLASGRSKGFQVSLYMQQHKIRYFERYINFSTREQVNSWSAPMRYSNLILNLGWSF